jgi:hypothetical protein
VSDSTTIADFFNRQGASAETIAQVCIDLVRTWSGGMSVDAMYRTLLENAQSPNNVDNMLYQLEGDPAYAENAALIVLSAAWNYPELAKEIERLTSNVGAATSATERELGETVLYGMYLMARGGAQVKEVSYRNADGKLEAVKIGREIPAAQLFDAVRDQYGASL